MEWCKLLHINGETVAVAVEAYLGGSVPVQNLFLELQKWRYAASVTLNSGSEGARKQDPGRQHFGLGGVPATALR